MDEDHEIRISPLPEEDLEDSNPPHNHSSNSSSTEEVPSNQAPPNYSPSAPPAPPEPEPKLFKDYSDSSSSGKEDHEEEPPTLYRRTTIQQKISSLSEYGIEINVEDPQVKSSTFSKHVIYTVSGTDSIGGFQVQRRYKEFLALRKVLVVEWPGCCIIQLPPKQAIVI